MSTWRPYQEIWPDRPHRTAGTIHVCQGVGGYDLAPRDVLVYLPPGYSAGRERHYPVLYLQDGQNVFDSAATRADPWGVDLAADVLAAQGHDVVIVAIHHGTTARTREFNPWFPDSLAENYLNFLLQTVKPSVEHAFHVSHTPPEIGIGGSSMGALIALYACFARPRTFSFCAALSPALWPDHNVFSYIDRAARTHRTGTLRVYLDIGLHEDRNSVVAARQVARAQRLRALLQARGYRAAYIEDVQGYHNASSWRRRFPAALAWFLDDNVYPNSAA